MPIRCLHAAASEPHGIFCDLLRHHGTLCFLKQRDLQLVPASAGGVRANEMRPFPTSRRWTGYSSSDSAGDALANAPSSVLRSARAASQHIVPASTLDAFLHALH